MLITKTREIILSIILIAFGFATVTLQLSCTSSPQALIIGKWEKIHYKPGHANVLPWLIHNRVELLKDGTLISNNMSFKYRIIDNDHCLCSEEYGIICLNN